jgi:exopolyphosphatase/guanosine-5'-triphosphate,3'-diphosphate pyrophosphatase
MAAIDIGSNAIRLIIAQRTSFGFQVIKKYRFPIRLGEDVFKNGKISSKKIKTSVRAFKKIHQIIVNHKVEALRTVGTSALREAKNSSEFLSHIRKKCKIRIELIDGVEEARLIQLAIKKVIQLEKQNCVLLDIGGGSIELTLVKDGMTLASQSYPFGTVRILRELDRRKWSERQTGKLINEYSETILKFIKGNKTRYGFVIGTGGNLETIANLNYMIKGKSNRVLSVADVNRIQARLMKLSIPERIKKLKLRRDRADVIIPATLLTRLVLKGANVKKIVVPGVGLREGVLWSMTDQSIQKILLAK